MPETPVPGAETPNPAAHDAIRIHRDEILAEAKKQGDPGADAYEVAIEESKARERANKILEGKKGMPSGEDPSEAPTIEDMKAITDTEITLPRSESPVITDLPAMTPERIAEELARAEAARQTVQDVPDIKKST